MLILNLLKSSSRPDVDRALQLAGLTHAARLRREGKSPADDMERLVLRLQTAPPERQPLLRLDLAVALRHIGQVDLAHDEARAYLNTREPTELDQVLERAREQLRRALWSMRTAAGVTAAV
jgi:hypothetical protein